MSESVVSERVRGKESSVKFDLPSYARVVLNELDKPLDPHLRVSLVLRVELPHAIRIDATWDWESGGYWISAWQPENGVTRELSLRWSANSQSLLSAVEMLSRQLS